MNEQKRLTARELEVLGDLPPGDFVRPMDIGGRDGSDHSRVLKSLARKGYVERQRRNSLMNWLESSRGSYIYRRPAEAPR
jgi:hypothetical protein